MFPAMKRSRVESSSIAAVGYDLADSTLEVEFRSGAVYLYSGVPKPVFDALMAAVAWAGTSGKLLPVYARMRAAARNCAEQYAEARH